MLSKFPCCAECAMNYLDWVVLELVVRVGIRGPATRFFSQMLGRRHGLERPSLTMMLDESHRGSNG